MTDCYDTIYLFCHTLQYKWQENLKELNHKAYVSSQITRLNVLTSANVNDFIKFPHFHRRFLSVQCPTRFSINITLIMFFFIVIVCSIPAFLPSGTSFDCLDY